jgi:hypothetical protein
MAQGQLRLPRQGGSVDNGGNAVSGMAGTMPASPAIPAGCQAQTNSDRKELP